MQQEKLELDLEEIRCVVDGLRRNNESMRSTMEHMQAQINNLTYMLSQFSNKTPLTAWTGDGQMLSTSCSDENAVRLNQWYVVVSNQTRTVSLGPIHWNIPKADIYFKASPLVIQLIIDGKQVTNCEWVNDPELVKQVRRGDDSMLTDPETEPCPVGFYAHDIGDINPIQCMADEMCKMMLEQAKKEAIGIIKMNSPLKNFYNQCAQVSRINIDKL